MTIFIENIFLLLPEIWLFIVGILVLVYTRINNKVFNIENSINKFFFIPILLISLFILFLLNNINNDVYFYSIKINNDFSNIILLQLLILFCITCLLKNFNLLQSKILLENLSLIVFLFITLNLMLKVEDFLLLFIVLECHNILLIGFSLIKKNSLLAIDGSIKYFFLSAFTTIFLLIALYFYLEFYKF